MPAFDVDALRREFPALAREQDGRPVAFLDGPGGTQVPQRVIDAVVGYYRDSNANADGAFATSRRSRRDRRGGARRGRRLPRCRFARGDQVRLQHVDAHAPHRSVDRSDARAARRDRRHDPRPRGERLDLEGDGRRPRRDRPPGRHPPRRSHPRPRGPRVETRAADETRRRRLREQRGRHGQSGPRDRRAGPRGRGAHVRRCRRLRPPRTRSTSARSTRTSS